MLLVLSLLPFTFIGAYSLGGYDGNIAIDKGAEADTDEDVGESREVVEIDGDADDVMFDIRAIGGATTIGNKFNFSRILRKASMGAAHLGLGATATVASAGAGGDTAVDILFLLLAAGELSTKLASVINISPPELLTLTDFSNGPEGVKQAVAKLSPETRAGIRNIIRSSADTLTEVCGNVLSAFVPDDAGLMAVLSSFGGSNSLDVLNGMANAIYKHIPAEWQAMLQDVSKLEKFMTDIIDQMKVAAEKVSDASWTKVSAMSWGPMLAMSVFPPLAMFSGTMVLLSLGAQTINAALHIKPSKAMVLNQLENAKLAIPIAAKLAHSSAALLFAVGEV